MYWIPNVRHRAATVAAGVSEWRSQLRIRAGGRLPIHRACGFGDCKSTRKIQSFPERSQYYRLLRDLGSLP
jgi:hypothetical protein